LSICGNRVARCIVARFSNNGRALLAILCTLCGICVLFGFLLLRLVHGGPAFLPASMPVALNHGMAYLVEDPNTPGTFIPRELTDAHRILRPSAMLEYEYSQQPRVSSLEFGYAPWLVSIRVKYSVRSTRGYDLHIHPEDAARLLRRVGELAVSQSREEFAAGAPSHPIIPFDRMARMIDAGKQEYTLVLWRNVLGSFAKHWRTGMALGVLFSMTGMALFAWQRRVSRRRIAMSLCLRCGYALIGIPDDMVCPECGGSRSSAVRKL